MTGRKILYLLRESADARRAGSLLPVSMASSPDEISVVLLDGAKEEGLSLPARIYVLEREHETPHLRPEENMVSYTDLLDMIFAADSTIVV